MPPHPHAAPPERLREALETLVPSGDWGDVPVATRVVLLPSGTDEPHLPPWLVIDAADVDTEAELHLSPWKVNGLALDVLGALDLLVALPLTPGFSRILVWPLIGCAVGAGIVYWFGPMLIVFGMFVAGTASVALRETVILFARKRT